MVFFDYIFYRVLIAYRKKDSTPEVYASSIVSLTQFFLTLILFDTIERFIELFDIPNKYYVLPLILSLMAFNWYRYEHQNKFEELDERWRDEPKSKRRLRGYLVVFAIFGSLLIPITFGVLRHNLGLDV